MESLDDYKEDIKNDILSGFYSPEDIISRLDGLDLDYNEMQQFVRESFAAYDAAVQTSSDVKALQELFDELAAEGYITLHKAGYTSSDAYDMIDEVLAATSFKPYGYLLYHEQDLYRTYEDGKLTLSFGAFRDTEQTRSSGKNKQETGYYFKSRMEEKGLKVEWNGNVEEKIAVIPFHFDKKYDGDQWGSERCVALLNKL